MLCYTALLPSIVEKFAQQMLEEDSNIKDIAVVLAAAGKYVSAIGRMQESRQRSMWDVSAKLTGAQSFPWHAVPPV